MAGPVADPRAGALLERYGRCFGASVDPPVPVEAIAVDLLGLEVVDCDDLIVSGALLPAERRVYLNAAEAGEWPGRRRFTLAHELGHWVCQCRGRAVEGMLCRSTDVGGTSAGRPLEREANVFAAELLMPVPQVRRAHGDGLAEPELATLFGTSEEAIAWRLFNLGLRDARPERAEFRRPRA